MSDSQPCASQPCASQPFDLRRIGKGLPVAETIATLPDTGHVVVQAPPGTGKTTLVPPAVANQVGDAGKVLVTVPRRVAVRAAAARLRALAGPDGAVSASKEAIGYAIRGESRPGSRIEFVTPGVLLRRLISDPALNGVAAVVLDEVHERQLDTDLALAMCLELAVLREDFRVIAMSATVDAQRFSQLLDAPVHTTQAPIHPLDIRYHPLPGRAQGSREFYTEVAREAAQLHAQQPGSTLVFVPGVREVAAVCDSLPQLTPATPVYPLHGQLSSAEQDAALNPAADGIVVATAIAESSVTVPGVRAVVDAGLSRTPRRDARRGMSGLVTVSTSASSAQQRAGRAGRQGPGVVVRCYSQEEFARFAAHAAPEITSADLTQAALFMECWGAGPDFPLPDAPPPAALDDAHRTLTALGATAAAGADSAAVERARDRARQLALMPTDPRLGAALLKHGAQAAATVAALGQSPRGDITRARAPRREVERLARLVRDRGPVDPGAVVAAAFPEQVARLVQPVSGGAGAKQVGAGRTGGAGGARGTEYLLAGGTRARLLDAAGLEGAQWLAIAEVSLAQSGVAVIRAAARITEAAALEAIGVSDTTRAFLDGGKVRAVRTTAAGAIILKETPVQPTPEQAAAALETAGLEIFTFSTRARNLLDRLRHLRQAYGEPWPDPHADLSWAAPEFQAVAEGASASEVDMYAALQRALPWPEAARLEELVPETLAVPSGRKVPIDWSGQRPAVAVKLQECFGLAQSPQLCGQRVQFQLLSPAGRPLALTDDLASFWAGPYAAVRAEMRGRYPKHPWPQDPWSAPPTAKTTAAMKGKRSSQ
ncbi:ATP-dependent RNA helicase [Corynebacterium lizhenjunii]|uniref:ATP-dependent RNA helicase n=1 Tax=Corynebacterium lizhenjunii TaxID=2709394 RepID=A0A7T0KFQ4_9CORY|nr:ATP-dependent helicase C-terminal domain-containing protein [Corynebacterium lizhenjunii]QPK79239.1 ATP-dependent RNA helicase [Corynebacterium lizhenjunii]